MKEKHLTIVVTEKCNLKCTYCYERNRTLRKPNLNKIKQFIIEEINDPKNKDFDFFSLSFLVENLLLNLNWLKKLQNLLEH